MKKRIIAGAIIIITSCILIFLAWSTSLVVAEQCEIEYNKENLINLINETQEIKDNAHTMANSARALGWDNEDKLIKELQSRWMDADKKQQYYQNKLDIILVDEARKKENERWAIKAKEFPTATYIWKYMKNLGWNDYICAGIMGNIMAEVGG